MRQITSIFMHFYGFNVKGIYHLIRALNQVVIDRSTGGHQQGGSRHGGAGIGRFEPGGPCLDSFPGQDQAGVMFIRRGCIGLRKLQLSLQLGKEALLALGQGIQFALDLLVLGIQVLGQL